MPPNYEILVSFSIVFQIIFFITAISLVGRLRKPGFYALTENTTPGIIMHLSLNGLGVIMVTLAVFGLIQ